MRKLTFIIFALGVILIFQSCATSEKELAEPKGILLGQSELEQLFKNECSYYYRNSEGHSGTNTCFPDGKQKMKWRAGSDTGTYRIINGQKCNKWKDTNPGKEECYQFYKIHENKYSSVCTNCSKSWILTFK